MARGAQDQASKNFDNSQTVLNQGKGVASTAGENAGHLYSTLVPQLEQEASNPTGYGGDEPAINTAAQQSTGGALAAVKGEAGLSALRTGNAGAGANALEESARDAMRTNSENALNVTKDNADLKQKQQQAGIAGLGTLYGENSNDELAALGQENNAIGQGSNAVNAETNAGNSGWFQNLTGFMNAAANVGSAASGFKH
ncbi:MAG TPA: hypothetical protein VGK24_05825 [Candidatus Angelobacter sp.]|jgi:hypothetical protein